MVLSLRPNYVRRYRDIVRLIWRYGHRDLVGDPEFSVLASRAQLDESDVDESDRDPADSDDGASSAAEATSRPDQLARDLEELGPTFVKLGQLLSTRPDLLSEPYRVALQRLQDHVEPFAYDDVEATIQEELGIRISKAFATFDEAPIASASLGQVHRATLRDGRQVAVKVQRPRIENEVRDDLGALQEIAGFCEDHFEIARRFRVSETVRSLSSSLLDELDYQREASNLRRIRRTLEPVERLHVPQAIPDYCSQRVLTMEYIDGTSVTDMSPLVLGEIDGADLADQLFRAYLRQILVDGFFHADPHPGNLLLTRDHDIALLDLGMVGFVTDSERKAILRLLLAIAELDGEAAADVAIEASALREDADTESFRRDFAEKVLRHQGEALQRLQIGPLILELSSLAAQNGILVPSGFNLLAKTLLNLDQIGAALAPDFDPHDAVRRHAAEISSHQMAEATSWRSLLSNAIEAKDLIAKLPRQAGTILERVAQNDIRIRVDAIDEPRLLAGLQQVANRVTSGLVLAALIVGAALLMNIDTPGFRLFGYPGFAIVLFSAAAFFGFALLLSIWRSERIVRRDTSSRRS